jgi:hypothetical protein
VDEDNCLNDDLLIILFSPNINMEIKSGGGGREEYMAHMERKEIRITFLSESLKENVLLRNQSIDGKMLLKSILKQQLLRLKTRLNWFQIGFSGSLL